MTTKRKNSTVYEKVPSNAVAFVEHMTPTEYKQCLKETDLRIKLLTKGYVHRHETQEIHSTHIPPEVIDIVILFGGLVVEAWSAYTTKYVNSFSISDKVIQRVGNKGRGAWDNVFATKTVKMNTGIHAWTIKLTASDGDLHQWVLFGLVPVEIAENFDVTKNDSNKLHWMINEYINGMALHLGNGMFFENGYQPHASYEGGKYVCGFDYQADVVLVTMVLDTNNRALSYSWNGKTIGVVAEVKEIDYRMAISLLTTRTIGIEFVSYEYRVCMEVD